MVWNLPITGGLQVDFTPGTMPGETLPWMAAAGAAFEGEARGWQREQMLKLDKRGEGGTRGMDAPRGEASPGHGWPPHGGGQGAQRRSGRAGPEGAPAKTLGEVYRTARQEAARAASEHEASARPAAMDGGRRLAEHGCGAPLTDSGQAQRGGGSVGVPGRADERPTDPRPFGRARSEV